MQKKINKTPEQTWSFFVCSSSTLSFEYHILDTVKRANKVVGMLSRYIEYKDKEIMVPLFKSLVRSILEYGNVVWCPYLKKHINLLENIQRRFTKRIEGFGSLDYETRLQCLKLPSLEFRRIRGDMIEVFKILRGFYDPVTTKSLLEINKSNTRGHPYKLTKTSFSSTSFQSFFTNRIINFWNSLPTDVVTSGTINIFKNALDKHWAQYMYKIDFEILSVGH